MHPCKIIIGINVSVLFCFEHKCTRNVSVFKCKSLLISFYEVRYAHFYFSCMQNFWYSYTLQKYMIWIKSSTRHISRMAQVMAEQAVTSRQLYKDKVKVLILAEAPTILVRLCLTATFSPVRVRC